MFRNFYIILQNKELITIDYVASKGIILMVNYQHSLQYIVINYATFISFNKQIFNAYFLHKIVLTFHICHMFRDCSLF